MTSINGVHDLQVLGLDHAWDDKLQAFVDSKYLSIAETLSIGDRYRVFVWDARYRTITQKKTWPPSAKPVNVATTSQETWVLAADRSRTHLWKVDDNFKCQETIPLSDYIWNTGFKNGKLV